jgi:hypothetical protein
METARKQPTAAGAHFRLLCLMAKAALNAEPEASLADIVEAVKVTAARARIPYDQLRPAIEAVIASGTTAWRESPVPTEAPVPRDPRPPTREEASALLQQLRARVKSL